MLSSIEIDRLTRIYQEENWEKKISQNKEASSIQEERNKLLAEMQKIHLKSPEVKQWLELNQKRHELFIELERLIK